MEEIIRLIVEDKKTFSMNLYEAGVADNVCCNFRELIQAGNEP